jgi:hypothetical protein
VEIKLRRVALRCGWCWLLVSLLFSLRVGVAAFVSLLLLNSNHKPQAQAQNTKLTKKNNKKNKARQLRSFVVSYSAHQGAR